MLSWAARRLAAAVLLVWLVATLTFLLVSLAPGDSAVRLSDPRLSPAARERWRHDFGLDRPLATRYANWLSAAATGDLGFSWTHRIRVTALLGRVLPNTVLLTTLGLGLEVLGGVVLALIQLRRPHGRADRILSFASLAAFSLPTFAVALLLVQLLSFTWPLFPPTHMHSLAGESAKGWAAFSDLLGHLVLPVTAIGITGVGAVARYLRGSLLDERAEQYVLASRARGCTTRQALVRHALPNALLPLITMVGMSLPFLVSGSLVIEVVFAWPGMGRAMFEAALARDVPVLMGGTLLATAAVVLGNFLADVAYAAVDPRVRA
jgi:peptide/nickel transport system permease protein